MIFSDSTIIQQAKIVTVKEVLINMDNMDIEDFTSQFTPFLF